MLDVDTQTKSSYYLDLSEAIINSIVGVVAINFGQEYFGLSVILGVIYLIVPSIKLAIAKIKLNQLFIDSFKFLAGFVIIASNANFVWWIKYIIGIVFLGVAISILITKLIHLNQARKGGTFYE